MRMALALNDDRGEWHNASIRRDASMSRTPISTAILTCAIIVCAPPGAVRAQGYSGSTAEQVSADPEIRIAISLADLLRGARTVISANQDLINDPARGDKGLSGEAVLAKARENAMQEAGLDLSKVDPDSRQGRLLAAMTASITEVMTINQALINHKGVGFKGFVPAVFGRLVTEQFRTDVNGAADIKVTAPPELVRNRKASPDEFETMVIRTKFRSPSWTKGELFAEAAPVKGRAATRVLVPEYYGAGCLSCHGEPKGQVDITGYPKEGAKLDELGGVISITLYK
jgi:hypothetical protein